MYSECLPENLTEETACQVVAIATPHASLNKLVNNCQLYLKNMALKQRKYIFLLYFVKDNNGR